MSLVNTMAEKHTTENVNAEKEIPDLGTLSPLQTNETSDEERSALVAGTGFPEQAFQFDSEGKSDEELFVDTQPESEKPKKISRMRRTRSSVELSEEEINEKNLKSFLQRDAVSTNNMPIFSYIGDFVGFAKVVKNECLKCHKIEYHALKTNPEYSTECAPKLADDLVVFLLPQRKYESVSSCTESNQLSGVFCTEPKWCFYPKHFKGTPANSIKDGVRWHYVGNTTQKETFVSYKKVEYELESSFCICQDCLKNMVSANPAFVQGHLEIYAFPVPENLPISNHCNSYEQEMKLFNHSFKSAYFPSLGHVRGEKYQVVHFTAETIITATDHESITVPAGFYILFHLYPRKNVD